MGTGVHDTIESRMDGDSDTGFLLLRSCVGMLLEEGGRVGVCR